MATDDVEHEENDPVYVTSTNFGSELAQIRAQYDQQIHALQIKWQDADNMRISKL